MTASWLRGYGCGDRNGMWRRGPVAECLTWRQTADGFLELYDSTK